ncbi:MAG: NupC/NupG family nucleoside CNT transporter [Gemmataceae bacterium]
MASRSNTPLRAGLFTAVVVLALGVYFFGEIIPNRVRSAIGVFAFLGLALSASANLRAINPRVVAAGVFLQVLFAVLILKVDFIRSFFDWLGDIFTRFVGYSNAGAGMLFGPMANRDAMTKTFGPEAGVPFAIILTTTVIFVASLFSVLYHLRILQAIVWVFAKLMILLMGKNGVSGAESLSTAANVFMGQTEAPLIVKPYVATMTKSELLAIMIGGMATIAGGVMAIYINMGADARAILATSVMAAPCTLYIAKILLPETEVPETRGNVTISSEKAHANVVDAAAAGASEGMMLSLNIIAMLIAFLALIALVNGGIQLVLPDWSLERFFANVFAPVAMLMGVDTADVPRAAELLGIKLVGNEFLAFRNLTTAHIDTKTREIINMSPRSYTLIVYALTGFANIGSIGIQLGGIGAMAPNRRGDLARLGLQALFGGFLATLINAAVAGVLIP